MILNLNLVPGVGRSTGELSSFGGKPEVLTDEASRPDAAFVVMIGRSFVVAVLMKVSWARTPLIVCGRIVT